MFSNQNFDVHAEIARPPKDFDHAARWRYAAARKPRQFHVDDCAVEFPKADPAFERMGAHLPLQFRRQLVTGRDDNFLQQPRLVWSDRVAARAVSEKAHDRGVCAVEHAEDASFGAARAISETAAALNARQDVIPMHGVTQAIAADE